LRLHPGKHAGEEGEVDKEHYWHTQHMLARKAFMGLEGKEMIQKRLVC